MSRTSTGRTTAPRRTAIPIQAAIRREERAQPDSNIHIIQAMKNPDLYGITTILEDRDVQIHTAMELYEMVYGGSADPFQGPAFRTERDHENKVVSDLIRDINVVSSIYKCPRPECGYTRILVRQEQLSAGDESATTLYRCTRCNFQWSDRGRG